MAAAHALVLVREWTLWDVSMVSVSALSAGVFFVLGMIFRCTVQDYKQADMAIVAMRGKLLSMHDLCRMAAAEHPSFDPSPFRRALRKATKALRGYVENTADLDEVDAALHALLPGSASLRKSLEGAQANLLLKQHEDVRQSLSYLAFLKHHNFPEVGYVFLWFFVGFILALQLFTEAHNTLLDTLFICSLTSIFVFFIAFIRDLDHPFRTDMACFALDTRPLAYVQRLLGAEEGIVEVDREPMAAPISVRTRAGLLWRSVARKRPEEIRSIKNPARSGAG